MTSKRLAIFEYTMCGTISFGVSIVKMNLNKILSTQTISSFGLLILAGVCFFAIQDMKGETDD